MIEKSSSTPLHHHIFFSLLPAFKKFNPLTLWRNPVIFITEMGAIVTTVEVFVAGREFHLFAIHISAWLWFTVFFANFAEAIAERRNKAQADFLKSTRIETIAHLVNAKGKLTKVNAKELKKGDIVVIKKGEIIPGDGEIIEGMASIDESSITGESEPVIRASGTDSSGVTGGTQVLSDEIRVRITSNPGESFLDRMIHLIEEAKRQKTPNEIALTILLSGLTFMFLTMILSLQIFGFYYTINIPIAMQVALLICLIPTTIGGLLSSIGIAGINRLMKQNVLALSGSSVEAVGDIDTLLIDKTGTITLGNRKAHAFITGVDVAEKDFIRACFLTSLLDETTEGRSIIEYIHIHYPALDKSVLPSMEFIPFSATTRMSGINITEVKYRKGAKDAIEKFAKASLPKDLERAVKKISEQGGTPLLVASEHQILGVIFLKDTVKPGLVEKFNRFRQMGIKTVMVTGDNKITARSIAKEVGVDDYLAEVSPEAKVHYIVEYQKKGQLVGMTGDGVNDAPALAQADVGVAMNSGAQAAKEASNMIDLDSNPTKLFEIIEIGKQMLITRGALTTFSIANDVSKYFAIIPAMLMPYFPFFDTFNIMRLSTPRNAVLSAVIFNALIIIALIPLALKGVKVVTKSTVYILNRNLLIYGIGGIILPFIGIKLIDMFIVNLNLF